MVLTSLFKKMFGNKLYYPGCLTKYVFKDIYNNYKKILNHIGIDYIEIPEINCCGSPVLNAGYEEEFKELIKKNIKILNDYSVNEIITSCPACYHTFKSIYSKYAKNLNVKITYILNLVLDNVDKIKFKKVNKKVTYHDPCHLGKHEGIYDTPRELIKKMGYEIIEMEENREYSLCCGAGGGVGNNAKETSNKILEIRAKQAKKTKGEFIVTACALCMAQLNKKFPTKEISELMVNQIVK